MITWKSIKGKIGSSLISPVKAFSGDDCESMFGMVDKLRCCEIWWSTSNVGWLAVVYR